MGYLIIDLILHCFDKVLNFVALAGSHYHNVISFWFVLFSFISYLINLCELFFVL